MRPVLCSEWAAALAPGFDPVCLKRYHVVAPCSIEQALANTLRVLHEQVAPDFALYRLPGGIGFVGVEPSLNFLTTFSLYPGCRTQKNAHALWAFVANLWEPGAPVHTAVYARNTPARRFLRRAGFQLQCVVQPPAAPRTLLVYSLAPSLCLPVD